MNRAIKDKKIYTNEINAICSIVKPLSINNPNKAVPKAVENPQVDARNMIVKAFHKVVGDFKLAGNPIKMSSYKDEKTRGDIPDLDEHRQKIIKEFCN